MRFLSTDRRNEAFRPRVIDIAREEILIARIDGSMQEGDLTSPTNCRGFGRVRHFRQSVVPGWPDNPLPIRPACAWLGIETPPAMQAQVFQIAACAWRCWYCFVPYASMRADPSTSAWWSATALVDAYLALEPRPAILDLSGGSPDLAPEWTVWMLKAIAERGVSASTYVWSDDNLSSDRLIRAEYAPIIDALAGARNYGKACCLKGFDGDSFSYNTRARPEGFERQLDVLAAYASTDIDIHIYLPLVGPATRPARTQVDEMLVRLASIRSDLPSRVTPLFISEFGTMAGRINVEDRRALQRQWELLGHFQDLSKAYDASP